MRYRLTDVVGHALRVLDDYGLADVSMRRLASELGVQPSALYHHVASKQQLLALMADEIVTRGRHHVPTDAGAEAGWPGAILNACRRLRDSLLAYRDGAELVATAHAFGLGATDLAGELAGILTDAGFDDDIAHTAARTLLHVTFGYAGEEQTHMQAASAGAIDGAPRPAPGGFDASIALVVDGLRTHRVDRELDARA